MRTKKNGYDMTIMFIIFSFALFCTLPVLLIFIISISSEQSIIDKGYSFFPNSFSLEAYSLIFEGNAQLVRSYLVSIFITVIGTSLAVTITGMAGYTLANKQVYFRNRIALFFFITMVFQTGLVPWYLVSVGLGLKDSILALIVPTLLFSPFNLFLTRNYMNGIPDALMESAKIDGASDAFIAFRIYFPLSMPVLATITLFYGLAYWNNWFNAIMLVSDTNLYPVQFLMFRLQSEISMLEQLESGFANNVTIPSESFKMAIAIITMGPIVLLYPYLQRYFIKGLIVGSVKG